MATNKQVQDYIAKLAGKAAIKAAFGDKKAADALIDAALMAGETFNVSADEFVIPTIKAALADRGLGK